METVLAIETMLEPQSNLEDKIQVQKTTLVLATNQIRCLISLRVESSVISILPDTTVRSSVEQESLRQYWNLGRRPRVLRDHI